MRRELAVRGTAVRGSMHSKKRQQLKAVKFRNEASTIAIHDRTVLSRVTGDRGACLRILRIRDRGVVGRAIIRN